MGKENKAILESADCEIISTRVFKYPQELVFNAWAEPDILAKWWGPKGFTNTFHEFDFKPGGAWKFVMHGPDGTDYQNKNVFIEIVKPGRIVFQHQEPIHKFTVTATFDDLGNKTRLSFSMLFESAKECNNVKPFVVDANEQNFDRLETQLAILTATT